MLCFTVHAQKGPINLSEISMVLTACVWATEQRLLPGYKLSAVFKQHVHSLTVD